MQVFFTLSSKVIHGINYFLFHDFYDFLKYSSINRKVKIRREKNLHSTGSLTKCTQ